jgi:hypothetical protein
MAFLLRKFEATDAWIAVVWRPHYGHIPDA